MNIMYFMALCPLHPYDEWGSPRSTRLLQAFKPSGPQAFKPSSLPLQLTQEPDLGELPVAHHGLGRDAEDPGGFLDGETPEEPQFHHLAPARIETTQRL